MSDLATLQKQSVEAAAEAASARQAVQDTNSRIAALEASLPTLETYVVDAEAKYNTALEEIGSLGEVLEDLVTVLDEAEDRETKAVEDASYAQRSDELLRQEQIELARQAAEEHRQTVEGRLEALEEQRRAESAA